MGYKLYGRQKPTGCVRLAHALRAVMKHRKVTATELSRREIGVGRSNISQWMHAHRAMPSVALRKIEDALDVDFAGVNRGAQSLHHYTPVCRADLAAGELLVTCRSTGNAIYPAVVTDTAATSNADAEAAV